MTEDEDLIGIHVPAFFSDEQTEEEDYNDGRPEPPEEPEEPEKKGPTGKPWGKSFVKADHISWGDYLLKQKEGVRHKHEVIAFMKAAGSTNKKIAQEISMGESWISTILSNTAVKERISEIQKEHWGDNIEARFKNTVPKAMDIVDEILSDPYGDYKIQDKLKAAMWLLEKVTGKAKQEVDHNSVGLKDLLGKLDELSKQGETIDITPQLPQSEEEAALRKQDSAFDVWIEQNIDK